MKIIIIVLLSIIALGKLVDAIEYYRYMKGGENHGTTTGSDTNSSQG